MASTPPPLRITIVIPIYNEAATIPELWRQLYRTLSVRDERFEVLFVDDGSDDDSVSLLQTLARDHTEIRILSLSRNFGHQSALSAGIDHAQGDALVLMDGDLQDSPADIPQLIQKWREGYGVVYAIRSKRKEFILKRMGFRLFYRLLNFLTPMNLPLDAGIFSLIDKRVAEALRQMPERNRYISGLRCFAGFRQCGLLIERNARYQGEPKVSLVKLIKLAFDALFSFSFTPLRLAVYFGLLCSVSSFCLGMVGLYYKYILGRTFLSWPFGLTTTFFMGGIQLVFLGIIGEYIGRIYEEVKRRPLYVVKDKIGF